MIYHYTDEEYDEAKAFEAGCQAEYEDHCKAETEAMMPPPKRIGNVRIKIGKKTPLWPVQNLHIPPGNNPVKQQSNK